jgi:hypothetical protein
LLLIPDASRSDKCIFDSCTAQQRANLAFPGQWTRLPLFCQVLWNFRLFGHEQRPELEIHDTEKACLLRMPQLDLRIRNFCTDRHHHIVSNGTQAATKEPFPVLNEKYAAGYSIVRVNPDIPDKLVFPANGLLYYQ